jgi:hypothetical protein
MKNDIETAKDHLLSYQRTLDDGLIGFRYSHEEAKMLVAYADQFIPKWISVEESKPKADSTVIVYNGEHVFIARFDDYYEGEPEWQDLDANGLDDITHWQPLPNSPSRLDEAAQNKKSKSI